MKPLSGLDGTFLHLAPIFQRKLAPMPMPRQFANPAWVHDDAVDLDPHVHYVQPVTLPAPGGRAGMLLAQALATAHGVKAWAVRADLSQPGAAGQLAAAMRRARRPIDALVNNAGVLAHGPFVGRPPARHRQLTDLNVAGLTEMLAHLVPPMVQRGHGRVLNLAAALAGRAAPKWLLQRVSGALVDRLK